MYTAVVVVDSEVFEIGTLQVQYTLDDAEWARSDRIHGRMSKGQENSVLELNESESSVPSVFPVVCLYRLP